MLAGQRLDLGSGCPRGVRAPAWAETAGFGRVAAWGYSGSTRNDVFSQRYLAGHDNVISNLHLKLLNI